MVVLDVAATSYHYSYTGTKCCYSVGSSAYPYTSRGSRVVVRHSLQSADINLSAGSVGRY